MCYISYYTIKCLTIPYFTEYEYIMNVQFKNSQMKKEHLTQPITLPKHNIWF